VQTVHAPISKTPALILLILLGYPAATAATILAISCSRGEWLPWTAGVRNSITACKAPLMDVSQALAQCWQDLTERIGTPGLRMREAAASAVLNEPVSA